MALDGAAAGGGTVWGAARELPAARRRCRRGTDRTAARSRASVSIAVGPTGDGAVRVRQEWYRPLMTPIPEGVVTPLSISSVTTMVS